MIKKRCYEFEAKGYFKKKISEKVFIMNLLFLTELIVDLAERLEILKT